MSYAWWDVFLSTSAPPAAPANPAAVAISQTQIDVSWDNVAGEDGFRVERSLTGVGRGQCLRALSRPVVLSEHERREVDFACQFKEALQCGRPRIEGCHPGLDVRDVLQTARECLKQLGLLS
jgi:hypothetical protein